MIKKQKEQNNSNGEVYSYDLILPFNKKFKTEIDINDFLIEEQKKLKEELMVLIGFKFNGKVWFK